MEESKGSTYLPPIPEKPSQSMKSLGSPLKERQAEFVTPKKEPDEETPYQVVEKAI
jgi:hypothetical protein